MRIGLDATPLPARPGGAGNYIIQLVRALAQLENDAAALAPELVVFAQASGRKLIEAESPLPQVEWVDLPDRSPLERLAWEQTGLPGLARRLPLDILHSLHYTRPLFLPCPSVVTFHDMTFFLFPQLHTRCKRLFFPAAIRYSARTARALIAVSESTRQDAIRLLGLRPERITTIPLGVGAEYHRVTDTAILDRTRVRYDLPPEFVLFVSTVEPRKNLPGLLEAYGRLVQRMPDAPPLIVVGGFGWMYEQVFAQVDALGLKERVKFTGYLPASDLPVVYNLAHLFVYPSQYEGFGLPPLEALACGTPVVTTAVSSMPEHVGDAALLVPPGDLPALVHAMQRILQDAGLREKLKRKGPQQAALYPWTRTARQTLNVYQQALDRD